MRASSLVGCGKTEVRQPISHDRYRRISGLRCEMGVRPRFFRNLLIWVEATEIARVAHDNGLSSAAGSDDDVVVVRSNLAELLGGHGLECQTEIASGLIFDAQREGPLRCRGNPEAEVRFFAAGLAADLARYADRFGGRSEQSALAELSCGFGIGASREA